MDMAMEWLVRAAIYGVQLAAVGLVAAVPAAAAGLLRKKPFSWRIFLLILCLEAGYAVWIWGHPWITCPDGLERPVSQEQREALAGYWGGFYSANVPILAHRIVVEENGPQGLRATVHYLWFGSIEVSLSAEGTPSIDRPLN